MVSAPLAPAATQTLVARHETAYNVLLADDVAIDHVAPSVVNSVKPPDPTATQSAVLTQDRPYKAEAVPLYCVIHVAPPSVVAAMAPPVPTA